MTTKEQETEIMKTVSNQNVHYLWFFAPSGHGKTKAVLDCAGKSDHILRKRLGLAHGNVLLCEESLQRNGEELLMA